MYCNVCNCNLCDLHPRHTSSADCLVINNKKNKKAGSLDFSKLANRDLDSPAHFPNFSTFIFIREWVSASRMENGTTNSYRMVTPNDLAR